MSNSRDNEKSQIEQEEDLKMKCKLKEITIINPGTGQRETMPHPRQEEIDELAKTDLVAAAKLAEEYRQKGALMRVKGEVGEVQRRAGVERALRAKQEREAHEKTEQLRARREISQALEALAESIREKTFPDLDLFFDAVASLTERKGLLTNSDLQMYASVRDHVLGTQMLTDAKAVGRLELLEDLNAEIDRRAEWARANKAQQARVIDLHDAAAFAEFYDGDPKKAEVVRQRALAKDKGEKEKSSGKPLPSFVDNVKSLFGFGKKKE